MKAGRELDALIADFMGQPFCKPTHGTCCTCQVCGHGYDECQCGYSEYIEMAWLVVEKLDMGIGIDKIRNYNDPESFYWDVGFDKGGTAQADTAPLAICLAALKAIE